MNELLIILATIGAFDMPPLPTAIIPAGPRITSIQDAGTNVNLTFESPYASNIVELGIYPDGPWSGVYETTNASSVHTVGKYPDKPEGFYRVVNQNGYTLKSTFIHGRGIAYDRRPFVGNNNLAVISTYDWDTYYNWITFITNGIATEIKNIGNNPCGYPCLQVDVGNKVLYTLENSCYYGATGPFTFREYNLEGDGGYITNAVQVNEFQTDSTFGDVGEDMLLLKSGGIVVCWKSPSSNYVFQYRAPNKQWKPIFAETNIIQAPSRLTLVQHGDGTVWCFITRDAYWVMPVVCFKEINGNLVWQWTDETILEKDGEFPIIIAQPYDNKLMIARAMKPYMMFSWDEYNPHFFRRGSSFGVCNIDTRTNYFESGVYPTTGPGYREQNMLEPVSPYAFTRAGDTFYFYRQEWNPVTRAFDLLYMTPYHNNSWGGRTYLYKALDGSNNRSGCNNAVTTFYNNEMFPMRNMFANFDSEGFLAVFEVTFP